MFIDRVTIRVEGGTGGSGAEAFHREPGNPRGGPSGGDGGDGGSVILVCDPQMTTLLDLRYLAEYQAPRGAHGEGSNRTGRSGENMELRAPPGTVAKDTGSGELLGELLEAADRIVLARGGRGGRGNARFATPTRQAPRHWEPGEPGEARTVELTLKLIADVGLVGKPNAGKSTFLAAVSAASPKVADYPFTTLSPNLGVVELPDFRSFVIADIPGIIEGAHEGKGLGHTFLRHIERTRTLALFLPYDDSDPQGTYDQLREELARYSPELSVRPHCIVRTKSDLMPTEDDAEPVQGDGSWGSFRVSAVTRSGLGPLLEGLWRRVQDSRSTEGAESTGTPLSAVEPGGGDGGSPEEGSSQDEEEWWDQAEAES